jgi:predicted helicase
MHKVKLHIKNYNYEVFRLSQEDEQPTDIDAFVNPDPAFLKWTDRLKNALVSGQTIRFDPLLFRQSTFRPFVKKWLYFDSLLVHRRYQQHLFFPSENVRLENHVITVSQPGYRASVYNTLITNCFPDRHVCASIDDHQCFPFFIYDEDGTNRRENVTDWALKQFQDHYDDSTIIKWDIFYYIYSVLHQPAYREKFAANLKRELPRIPFREDFRAFAEAGKQLADLHLNYEKVEPWPLTWICVPRAPLSYRVEKMRLNKDKTKLIVNETLSLGDIPPEVFQYRLGNRSALEWIIDQYQVSEDKRSGIKSDPNRKDDPEFIVRLAEQVVRVSVETVRIVNGLPAS